MIEFSEDEKKFLRSHNIPLDKVFDGRRYTREDAKTQAQRLGIEIVYGSPCNKAKHRLRTRSGHCIQCDPKKIAYQARHRAIGYVYLAKSRSQKLVKIGTCSDLSQRENSLCAQSYGGISDWRIIVSKKCPEAGRVESDIHTLLSSFRVQRTYEKDGADQAATELFCCDADVAIDVFKRVLGV